MRKGKVLTADQLMVTCGTEKGLRVLRVCRPRGTVGLKAPQLGQMLLMFDSSVLCPPGKNTQLRNRTSSNCKKRYELLVVPLREDIPDRTATSIGRQIINACFVFSIETARTTTTSKEPNPPPYRVHSPARNAGTIGAAA